MTWRTIAVVFLVALTSRAAWGVYREATRSDNAPVLEFPDEQQYWIIARSIAEGNGMRDELGFRASRMPLYPAFLSVFASTGCGLALARAFHWLLGAAGAVVVGLVATRLIGGRVGLMAGLLVALDPFLIFSSSLLLTETPFILVLGLLFHATAPLMAERAAVVTTGRIAAVGLLSALCVYVRESGVGLIVLLVALIAVRRGFDGGSLKLAGGTFLLLTVALVPWMARNDAILGRPVWLTTRGGISLLDGVGPQADGSSNLGRLKTGAEVTGLSELEWNDYFLKQALASMRADPRRIARLALVKAGRMWNPIPNVDAYRSLGVRLIAAGWSVPVFALAVGGAIILLRRRDGVGVWCCAYLALPAVYFTLLHSVFVGSVRYRLPGTVLLEVLAALAIITIGRRTQRPTRWA